MTSPERLLTALGAETALALTDDNNDGVPDAAPVEEAVSTARRFVALELHRAGWDVPDTWPGALDDIVLTLAVEYLFLRRRQMLPGSWSERADRARTLLREIGDGTRSVPGLVSRRTRIVATGTAPAVVRGVLDKL